MDPLVIEKIMKDAGRRYYWVGVAVGLLAGAILGGLIGYSLGSDQVVVIPLERGIDT